MIEKTMEIEAESLEEARKQVQSRMPQGFRLLSENVLSDGKPKTVKTSADTEEAAFAKAQSEIPTNADVLEKKELYSLGQQVIAVEASDEQSAMRQIKKDRNATILGPLKLVTLGKKGFLGIGRKPNQYEAEVVQQAVVEVTYRTKAKVSVKIGKEEATRRGDGTILGDVISKGVYKPQAGSERIGYFNPEIDPFRTFPNGKTGLRHGSMADQLIQMIPASRGAYGSMLDESGDIAVDLAIKLRLSSIRQVSDTFQQLVKKEAVSQFLIVTTTMPFFLMYSTRKVIILAEVDHELKLNALAHLLLKDPSFSSVHSVPAFEAKATSLLDERKQEVEEKKQWAIDLQKSR